MRFEGQKAAKGHGRAVPRHSHDQAYHAMPETVGYIQEHRLCDRLCIYDIDHKKVYDNRLDSRKWTHEEEAERVIHEIRSLPLSRLAKESYADDAARVLVMMREHGADRNDISSLRETLTPFLEEQNISLPSFSDTSLLLSEKEDELSLYDKALRYAAETYPGNQQKQQLLTDTIVAKASDRGYDMTETHSSSIAKEGEAEL